MMRIGHLTINVDTIIVYSQIAVKQIIEQYINQQKPCNNNDLSDCLLKIHNNKNDVKNCLQVSDSAIARLKQQYKLNTVCAQRKSYNKSTADDINNHIHISTEID